MNDKTNKLNRLCIDVHEDPYKRLYSAIFQQAVIDFDKCCFYRKHNIKQYYSLNEKIDTDKEYKSLLKYFDSVSESEYISCDVKKVVYLIQQKYDIT